MAFSVKAHHKCTQSLVEVSRHYSAESHYVPSWHTVKKLDRKKAKLYFISYLTGNTVEAT